METRFNPHPGDRAAGRAGNRTGHVVRRRLGIEVYSCAEDGDAVREIQDMTDTLSKLEVLRDAYDPTELDLILEKLLGMTLSRQRARLARYERDLRAFEERYHQDSTTFSQQFEAGKLGDAMDFFEWMGLYTLRQDLLKKIQQLESVA